jgi:translation initiation factor IF-3
LAPTKFINKNLHKKTLINNQIRSQKIRFIDETGKQVGIISLTEALEIAKERNLDLIQVTEKVEPPVCKLGDYGKYLYLKEKKEKSIQKQKNSELKGIRISFNISLYDMETRAQLAKNFLNKGNRVKIDLPLRGREKAHGDFAKEKVNKFLELLKESVPIKIEKELKREPRGFTIIISKNQHVETKNSQINH